MDRRSFLGLGLGAVTAAGNAAVFGAEEVPSLPTSIPGHPQHKILHFRFESGIVTNLISEYGGASVFVPTFCFGSKGNVLWGGNRDVLVPLSHPVAQKGLREELQYVAKCLDNKITYVSLVTSKESDGLVYRVGICSTLWRPRRIL